MSDYVYAVFRKRIPFCYVYRHFDTDGRLLYVGISNVVKWSVDYIIEPVAAGLSPEASELREASRQLIGHLTATEDPPGYLRARATRLAQGLCPSSGGVCLHGRSFICSCGMRGDLVNGRIPEHRPLTRDAP